MPKINYVLKYSNYQDISYADCLAKMQEWFDARPDLSRDDYVWGIVDYDGTNHYVLVWLKKEGRIFFDDVFEPHEEWSESTYKIEFVGWEIPTPLTKVEASNGR